MVKFLVTDVDGTLTDGKIYMGANGEAFKAFDIKDGYALHTLLKEHGIVPVIITARKSPMVEHRCKELGVTEIHQGIMNKLDCLKGILEKYSSVDQQYDLSNVAYIGDDVLDLQCMKPITEAGGIAGCPSNAVKEVVAICDFVASDKGGEGAVRAFSEYLLNYNRENVLINPETETRVREAVSYLSQLKDVDLILGKHEVNDTFFYNVQEYVTDNDLLKPYESHRKYIDIQFLVLGEEVMQVTDVSGLHISKSYDEEHDCIYYHSSSNESRILLRPGSVLILYPKDGHRSLSFDDNGCFVKKVVGKVKIN